ncbi:hypothetical protein H1O16_gp159 [Burkholderia phage BcepSaruman]|uniref:Uncharacterized protein n=1 Tax=Burkholderia phage BcepSaruman TaxID=2530032 RepID=A0A4D5ZGC7_9CAUD|nr:hypothetical protein H1O16_gp159 [Burkholderia phage BcepSaruman]QBX06572.1 hypothetical protein BcepSaruman_159 [Burkholderia phage BcepSaruman]
MLKEIFGFREENFPVLAGATFAYLFGRRDQDSLVATLREIEPESVDRVLAVIRAEGIGIDLQGATGYVLCNCKLYAWAYFRHRMGGEKPRAVDFKIDADDARFLRRLNLNHLSFKYPAYRLATWQAKVYGVIEELERSGYIGKFMNKKMKFLMKPAFGLKREDLKNDMTTQALRAMYLKYPRFDSELHITNVAKTTISNTGKTLISYHTNPSRQRLQLKSGGDKGEFESRLVTTEALSNMAAPDQYMGGLRDSLTTLVQLSKNMRPDVQRFLLICAGHHDRDFSEFLKRDNASAVDSMDYTRYIERAREHFGFTENQVTKLFAKLKTYLEE